MVDGPSEDRACEIANSMLFELAGGGCVEVDREDRTLHRPEARSSFTVTVKPAGLALSALIDAGYHVAWDADSYSAGGILVPAGTPAPSWDD